MITGNPILLVNMAGIWKGLFLGLRIIALRKADEPPKNIIHDNLSILH